VPGFLTFFSSTHFNTVGSLGKYQLFVPLAAYSLPSYSLLYPDFPGNFAFPRPIKFSPTFSGFPRHVGNPRLVSNTVTQTRQPWPITLCISTDWRTVYRKSPQQRRRSSHRKHTTATQSYGHDKNRTQASRYDRVTSSLIHTRISLRACVVGVFRKPHVTPARVSNTDAVQPTTLATTTRPWCFGTCTRHISVIRRSYPAAQLANYLTICHKIS